MTSTEIVSTAPQNEEDGSSLLTPERLELFYTYEYILLVHHFQTLASMVENRIKELHEKTLKPILYIRVYFRTKLQPIVVIGNKSWDEKFLSESSKSIIRKILRPRLQGIPSYYFERKGNLAFSMGMGCNPSTQLLLKCINKSLN